MTLIGAIGALFFSIKGRKPHFYKGAIYFEVGGPEWGGVNFGPFFFVDTRTNPHIVMHEWGHGIQNIILGPLMPFLVAIPSCIRYWYRELLVRSGEKKYADLPDYDSVWFEGWATKLGKKYYKVEDYEKSR